MSNKCFRCKKSCYDNERVKADGKYWHIRKCFTCFNPDCKRKLEKGKFTPKNDGLYCPTCYGRLFGARGFRGGGGGQGGVSTTGVKDPKSEMKKEKEAPAPKSTSKPSGGSFCSECGTKNEGGKFCMECGAKLVVPDVQKSEPKKSAPVKKEQPKPRKTWGTPPGAHKKKKGKNKFGGSPKCPVCGKSVFANEACKALGNTYHKKCFKCSDCKKSLDSMNLRDGEGKLWCKVCHSKHFGPKGFGIGNSAAVFTGK